MKLRKNSFLTIYLLVVFSVHILGFGFPQEKGSTESQPRKLSKKEKKFCKTAKMLIDKEKFNDVIELSDKEIGDDPKNAIYYQTKGLAYVLKYLDSGVNLPWIGKCFGCKSCTKNAVNAFRAAKKLDPKNEDKAIASIVLAHVVKKDLIEAKKVFEPAMKKHKDSLLLNYVGIEYYKEIGDEPSSRICKNFVSKHNPEYDGKPVFAGLTLLTIATIAKILAAAIIVGYFAGYTTRVMQRN
ncbi:MAG: hypothetical protein KAT34_06955 [Candidatus Aminicenantes bacterium]|nr:hypothetical protein [Candidatus Aminicenantes bacterium]